MQFKNLLLTIPLLLPVLASGAGGSEVGNGSDFFSDEHQSAWFLGADRTISACLEMSEDFFPAANAEDQSARRADAKASILWAFAQWTQYIQTRGIERGTDSSVHFAKKLEISDSCSRQVDLKLYMGVENAEVQESKRNSKFANPLAFVQRLNFDSGSGWSHGFLWIRNSELGDGELKWNLTDALRATLLHEMGHIFGIGHVADTVMQADFAHSLRSAARVCQNASACSFSSALAIDGSRQLALEPLWGLRRADIKYPLEHANRVALVALAGRELTGEASCAIDFSDRAAARQFVQFNCRDDLASFTRQILLAHSPEKGSAASSLNKGGPEHAFRRVRRDASGDLREYSTTVSNVAAQIGSVVLENGHEVVVMLERMLAPLSAGQITLKLRKNGEWLPLAVLNPAQP